MKEIYIIALRLLVILGFLCLGPSGSFSLFGSSAYAVEANSYDQALKQVSKWEATNKSTEAADALEGLVERYPQDYGLMAHAARLHFELGKYQLAARRYRQAMTLSEGSLESRLGLAWSLLRQGDRPGARRLFTALHHEFPADPSARKGLRLSKPTASVIFSPSFFVTFYGYPDHSSKNWGLGGLLSLPLMIKDRVFLQANYRFSNFFGPRGQGSNGNTSGRIASIFQQHEGFISGGLVLPSFGILGQYALIYDGDVSEAAHIAGLSARYSPWGDLLLDLSASIYPDLVVLRAAPAWRIRPLPWLTITPGVAVQGALEGSGSAAAETLVTGSLGVAVSSAAGSLWIGGKVGAERRPAYLSVPAVYNIPEQINFGLWAGASLKVGRGALFLSYELNQLELDQVTSMMHLATLGFRWK